MNTPTRRHLAALSAPLILAALIPLAALAGNADNGPASLEPTQSLASTAPAIPTADSVESDPVEVDPVEVDPTGKVLELVSIVQTVTVVGPLKRTTTVTTCKMGYNDNCPF